ncbi:AbiH family protein [Parvibaculum sp.]|uniref:AbiH family protein n=1 Tax=Parvibaculum sp. TaxID=2024848 RepID=UPI001D9824C8|nr:AbiH family protein [Parvibaculum sp.]MBX3489802.1 hypothetical protein [Parvibaculum sp.]
MTTLYVIGTGFDLHHGMATGYKHIGEFLKRNHRELYNLLPNRRGDKRQMPPHT